MAVSGHRLGLALAALLLVGAPPLIAAEGPPRIKEVIIDPTAWQWRGSLQADLGLVAGQIYREDDVRRAIDLLRATDGFTQVEAVTTLSDGGASIRFEMTPKPFVSRIVIEGNFSLLEREITSVIQTTVNGSFSAETAEKDRVRIERLYVGKGFFGSKAVWRIEPEAKGRARIVFDITEGRPGVVQRIVFQGNASFSAAELSAQQKNIVLSFYSPEDLQDGAELIAGFYRGEGFIEAKVTATAVISEGLSVPSLSITQPLKSIAALRPGGYVGVDLRYLIVEGARYSITLEGNRGLSTRELSDQISFYQSGFFDQYEMEQSRDDMLGAYRNAGYPQARIEIEFDHDAKRAVFHIAEGPLVHIRRIMFEGQVSVASRKLLALMSSRPGTLSPTVYRADVLEEDLKRLKAFYIGQGHSDAECELAGTTYGQDGTTVTLLIKVTEGPATHIGSISFTGLTAYDEARLAAAVKKKSGDAFDPEWVETAKKAILDLYSRLGFADCTVRGNLSFNADGSTVDMVFEVHEGRQRSLGRVVVAGNRSSRPEIILREFAFKEGQLFDPVRFFEARRRLYDTGIFSRVEIVSLPPQDNGVTDLLIKVRERSTGKFSLGVGYDSEELLRGFVEYGEKNLLGSGRGLRLRYKLSTIGQRYDIIYYEPWMFGFHQDLNFNLFNENKAQPGYDEHRTGLNVYTDRKLAKRGTIHLAYRYERVDLTDVTIAPGPDADVRESYRIGAPIVGLSWDARDDPAQPHSGFYLNGSTEIAWKVFGSQVEFNKFDLEAVWVQPLGPSAEFVLGLRSGLERRLDPAGPVPISERYYAGGASTVRGYGEKSIGPKDAEGHPLGGEYLLVANAELRFRFYHNFGAEIFLDAGGVWERSTDYRRDDIREGVGFGLYYATPVGPVRLDYGHKIDRRPGEDPYRIHFTFGFAF